MSYTVTRFAKGTIWWCNLSEDFMLNHMHKGRRPCLIISSSETNEIEHACTILPISTAEKYDGYTDTHQVVKFNYSGVVSYVMCNMPRRVSTFKLDKYYGTLSDELFDKVMSNYLYYLDYDNKVDNGTDLSSVISEVLKFISTTKSNAIVDNKVVANDVVENISMEKFVKKPEVIKEGTAISNADTKVKSNTQTSSKAEETMTNTFDRNTAKTATTYKNKWSGKDNIKQSVTNTDKPVSKSKLSKSNSEQKRKTNIKSGYWLDIKNNIEFWNEWLIGDINSMIKKYGYKNRDDVAKRKYNVKHFLLNNGYTVEDLKTFIEK